IPCSRSDAARSTLTTDSGSTRSSTFPADAASSPQRRGLPAGRRRGDSSAERTDERRDDHLRKSSAVEVHQEGGSVRREDLAHAVKAGLLVATDGAGVRRRWVDLHPCDPRVGKEAFDEGADHSGAEALAESRAVCEKLIDPEDAPVAHLEPPTLGVTCSRLVRLDVADRLAVESREVLGEALFELDRPLPPLGHVRTRNPRLKERQVRLL